MKTWRLNLILLTAMVSLHNTPALGCGPFFPRAIFTYTVHPDFPLNEYAEGKLGVLEPTYARSYLYVAYRYLIGKAFDKDEQKAIIALWDERLPSRTEPWFVVEPLSYTKEWYDARSKVVKNGAGSSIDVFKALEIRNGAYNFIAYFNCPRDAFQTAVKTLNGMKDEFGVESPEVKEWVLAQDQVFNNCSGGKSIPEPVEAISPQIIQANRAYQIAGAHFYAGDFDMAENLFTEIANDPSSPWKQIAPYLVARTLVRTGTLLPGENEVDRDSMTHAENQLKKVLNDQSLIDIHPAARRLMGYVLFRLNPEKRIHELAQDILREGSGKTLKNNLWDYTLLLDKFTEEDLDNKSTEIKRDDVTDWILTFKANDEGALEHAIKKWEETSSEAWLFSSLSKINSGHPKMAELLEAAKKVNPDSPAYPSVAFHSLRLMSESGREDEARKKLDQILSQSGEILPTSSYNLFLALRMKLANSLDELLGYAPRVPAGITFDYDGMEIPLDYYEEKYRSTMKEDDDIDRNDLLKTLDGLAFFDIDSSNVLNREMPLSLLIKAVKNKDLPPHLRREVVMEAWVRALLLNDEGLGIELVPIVQELAPELKNYLDGYLSAKDSESRKFAGIYTILKSPGLMPYVKGNVGRLTPFAEIDNFRDNWWCSFNSGEEDNSEYDNHKENPLDILYPNLKDYSPEFLSEAEKAEATKEINELTNLGSAPNYLCKEVVEWTKAHPDEPRNPEALHLAVKSTRYGCTDEETGKFSKAAFQLLHKKYPNSEWAKKSKYWYD